MRRARSPRRSPRPLQADGGSLAADPLGGLQTAYDQLTQAAVAFGKKAGPNVKSYSSPQPRPPRPCPPPPACSS